MPPLSGRQCYLAMAPDGTNPGSGFAYGNATLDAKAPTSRFVMVCRRHREPKRRRRGAAASGVRQQRRGATLRGSFLSGGRRSSWRTIPSVSVTVPRRLALWRDQGVASHAGEPPTALASRGISMFSAITTSPKGSPGGAPPPGGEAVPPGSGQVRRATLGLVGVSRVHRARVQRPDGTLGRVDGRLAWPREEAFEAELKVGERFSAIVGVQRLLGFPVAHQKPARGSARVAAKM